MIRSSKLADETDFFNLRLAKWVIGVLGMLIAVVGDESLVGLILRQTRCDLSGLVRDEEQRPETSRDTWYLNN